MTDGQFDKKIREILSEQGEQLSPEALDRIWAGVESGLDSASGRRGTVVPRRRWLAAVSSVAAAVAVAFGIAYFIPSGQTAGDEVLAESAGVEAESSVGTAPAGEDIPAAAERLLADAGAVAAACGAEAGESGQGTWADNPDMHDSGAGESVTGSSAAGESCTGVSGTNDSDTDVPETEGDQRVPGSERSDPRNPGRRQSARRRPFELTVGGNSFVGPQKSSGPVRLSSKGNRTPSGKEFVEGSNSDTYSLPISFGVGVKYNITKWLGVGVGLSYTLLNKKVTGTYYDADGWCCSAEMKNSQHYIGIPLDIYFSLFRTKQWNAYAAVGGAVEKCVRNRYTGTFDGESLFYTREVGGVQTSVKAGLGIEYSPLDFLGIYIDPSIRYYFAANQPRSIRTAQPLAFGVEAGLRFRL